MMKKISSSHLADLSEQSQTNEQNGESPDLLHGVELAGRVLKVTRVQKSVRMDDLLRDFWKRSSLCSLLYDVSSDKVHAIANLHTGEECCIN